MPGLPCSPSCLPTSDVIRHLPAAASFSFSFDFTIASVNNKLEDVLEIVCDRRIDIFCVTESWHDADSACLGRLRSAGFNVVDRLHPRVADDLSYNHGGGVVFSAADLALKPLTVDQPSSFGHYCLRLSTGICAVSAVVLRRTGCCS